MKIAYILDLFPVTSETFIVREILELERNGFDIHLFAIRDSAGTEYSKVIHPDSATLIPKTIYLSSLNRLGKLGLILYHLYFLISNPVKYVRTFKFAVIHDKMTFIQFKKCVFFAMKLRKMRIEHIHAHFALEACKYSMLIHSLTGIPYSFTMHAHDIFRPDLLDLVENKFNNAKFIASISNYNKKYILEKYQTIDSKKIKIIHCGIDVNNFLPKENTKVGIFNIISVGRLHQQKGYKYLIQACHFLKNSNRFKFICKIIGDGIARPELENEINKYGLSKDVLLLGAKTQTEVKKLLDTADVFVLPCAVAENGAMDGIPVALMEAMAIKIPVISTRISGIPELITNDTGFLVEPMDSKGLAEAIESAHFIDEDDRNRMTRKARSTVEEQFNLSVEANKLANIFNNMR